MLKSLWEINSQMDEENLIEKRKEKVISFLKNKKDFITYGFLAIIIFISLYIRTRNIPKLKNVATGLWTLGPDLDPFLFLRWARYIVENGKLMAIDTMRYSPIGYDTSAEMKLLSYMIAWFHNFLSFFSNGITVTYSAILFPVFMAGLTAIAFFLFTRKIFYKEKKTIKNLIVLVATAFFVLIPSLLPRTIAGIPEKESAGFFFIFIGFYFFLEAFTSTKFKKSIIYSILAGISTGLLALIWGGVTFVFITISGAVLVAFFLGKINLQKIYLFGIWMASFSIIMIPFSSRYTLNSLLTSTSTGLAFLTLFIMIIDFLLFKKNIFNQKEKLKNKIKLPREVISMIIAVILLILISSTFFGISFIPNQIKNVIGQTVHPLSESRFGITVAENRQPYFAGEWRNNFGPIVFNIPLYFWMFIIGSVTLFGHLIKTLNKKEKFLLITSYSILLLCLIFSRYSSRSKLNGENWLSLLMYFIGFIIFAICFIYAYYNRYKKDELSIFKRFNFAYILYFVILTMSIIGARGAIRLIMVLGAITPVAIAFLCVKIPQRYFKEKEESKKFFVGIMAIIIILSAGFILWSYYNQDKAVAENFAPNSYTQQWQKAMFWVDKNTSSNAVFAHWWDYGYWVQSIGKRATILDGGNSIGYWNHLMGRHVLTGTDEKTAIEFLYVHNGTHLLIDSTEIGKYTAYSSIGSNKNYDRFSWIPTFIMDSSQTQETKDEIIYLYRGGSLTDEDIVWKENGKEIFLPKKKAAIGGIFVKNNNGELSAKAVFVYNGNQYYIPLRYLYFKDKLYDFGEGLDAGVFIFPKIDVVSGRGEINEMGAMFYFSGRTIHSNLVNLYLFEKESEYFKLAHTESSAIIEMLKQQGQDFGEFVYYQGGFQGPIKIWEINYPSNIEYKKEYLNTDYPDELNIVEKGEYN